MKRESQETTTKRSREQEDLDHNPNRRDPIKARYGLNVQSKFP